LTWLACTGSISGRRRCLRGAEQRPEVHPPVGSFVRVQRAHCRPHQTIVLQTTMQAPNAVTVKKDRKVGRSTPFALLTILSLALTPSAKVHVMGRAIQPTCMVTLDRSNYVVRITGRSAYATCKAESRRSKGSSIVVKPYTGTLKGFVLVCQGIEKDGNLHQIFSKSKADTLARLACAFLRDDLRR